MFGRRLWLVIGITTFFTPLFCSAASTSSGYYETKFIVTAYYSPIPGQKEYALGSLEADRILNGNGIAGADGTPVYFGMIAAPPEFRFGTPIHLDGVGLGEVHDRGGAIKNNRLDIWVGYGDEGLARAREWGKRVVTGKVYSPDAEVDASAISADSLLSVFEKESGIEGFFRTTLSIGDIGNPVKTLSRYLRFFGYYFGDETDVFTDELRQSLTSFQIANDIVEHRDALGAGIFGPVTMRLFNEIVGEIVIDEYVSHVLYPGSRSTDQVKTLQRRLKMLGFFDAEVSGVYGFTTQKSVTDFQISQGIASSSTSPGAGAVGPRTLEAINDPTLVQDIIALDEKEPYRFSRIMSEGDKGESVVALKQRLQTMGLLPSGPVDPLFDEDTKRAIISLKEREHSDLERDMGVVATGIVDPETIILLNAPTVDQIQLGSKDIYQLDEIIYFGDRHPQVRRLKKKLHLLGYATFDSFSDLYDTQTKEGVFEFQKDYEILILPTDLGAGQIGPRTMKTLNSVSVPL